MQPSAGPDVSVSPLTAPQPVLLRDYRPPAFLIDAVELTVALGEREALVSSVLHLRRNPEAMHTGTLVLNGRGLRLRSIRLDGSPLVDGTDYVVDPDHLRVLRPISGFATLAIETAIAPQDNTELEGLYQSSGMFCTQCEAEGFRKITYYLDRPDVLARFTTTVVADRKRYPVLLSNGNLIDSGDLPDGRHFARWYDPFPKPAYLFALVAGDLACLSDSFVTRSGRRVDLKLYAAAADLGKCDHAMASLKRAMEWDEAVYGLEYDLDIYMIVAVGDFNMGAMENKGLNVFNTKYVLARPDTATDQDYRDIETVIGHEYFHNWTGNRVTCRDWFQLSLKEGLTVFRDQQFSADMGSPAVKRVTEMRALRAVQFTEDSGPMAHPVRPDSYIEINNFYTPTVYMKGAEVVRMIHTLLGQDGFRRGMDVYIARHDGQAVTCDDFVAAMEHGSGVDLGQFRLWYSQAGTPILDVSGVYDPADGSYTMTVEQSCPPTAGQTEKLPFHIPLRLALFGPDGRPMRVRLAGEKRRAAAPVERVLDVTETRQSFRFVDLPANPVPSLLRGFSAPVKVRADLSDAELCFLMAHDNDPVARWEAGQSLATRRILDLVDRQRRGAALAIDRNFIEAIEHTLMDERLDAEFIALAITLPGEPYLIELAEQPDPIAIHTARDFLRRAIGAALSDRFSALYNRLAEPGPARFDTQSVGRRALRNVALAYRVAISDGVAMAEAAEQVRSAPTMTEVLAALTALADSDAPERAAALEEFAARWQCEPLVLDKWFAVQATSSRADTINRVADLLHHPAFDRRNPNRVRALVSSFAAGNPYRFHAPDGSGYRFLADQVLALDAINGKVASRLLSPLIGWRKFDEPRQWVMRAELDRIVATPGLSKDVYEIASKGLSAQ